MMKTSPGVRETPVTTGLPYHVEFQDVTERYDFRFDCVPATDGYPLYTYEFGKTSDDGFVLVGAVGTSSLLMMKLASQLATSRYSLCYEHRGSPYLKDSQPDREITVPEYASDLGQILSAREVKNLHLVGHCSSANIISWAVSRDAITPSSVTLIAPAGIGSSSEKLYAQEVFFPMLQNVTKQTDPEARKTVATVQNLAGLGHKSRVRDSDVQRITLINIRDFRSARRYAHLLSGAELSLKESALLFDDMCAKVPVLVLHALDDQVISHTSSVNALGRNSQRNVRLVLYPSGTHFLPYTRAADIASEMTVFQS